MADQAVVGRPVPASLSEGCSISKPKKDEILVNNAALAIYSLDWKMQELDYFTESYPTRLDSDIAGTVEAVDSGVPHFRSADRLTSFTDGFASKNSDHAAFQQFITVKAYAVANLHDSLTFTYGAILPISVATAAIFSACPRSTKEAFWVGVHHHL